MTPEASRDAVRRDASRDASALRVRARRDVSELLAGAYRSAFRGQGLVFEELREYSPGDDAARIEWKATARLGHPIVKRMREERDLVLALLVDVSDSLRCGTSGETRRRAAFRTAAALASAAIRAQDRVAMASFSDALHSTLRPAGGPLQLERVFRVLESAGGGARSDAADALAWATDTLPRHTVVVLISDLHLPEPGPPLAQCASKHDLIVLRVIDDIDTLPARIAPIRVRGAEGGARRVWRARRSGRAGGAPLPESALRRRGADYGEIGTGPSLVPDLHRFFEKRAGRPR